MSTLYAVNTDTFGISQYSPSTLRDMTIHENMVYLLTATAVNILTGATDNGVEVVATLVTGELDPAGGREFNIPKVSLGVEGAGTLTVQTQTKERGAVNTNTAYSIPTLAACDQYECVLERRQCARAYKFTFTMAGTGIKLISLDAYVDPVLHRRGV